jgi:hypothetical protein
MDMDVKNGLMKRISLFILLAVSCSGCFVKPNGGYVLFLDPRIKCEYCTDQEAILGASEFLLKRIWNNKIADYNVTVRECGDSLVLTYIRKDIDFFLYEVNDFDDKTINELVNKTIDTSTTNYRVSRSIRECGTKFVIISIPVPLHPDPIAPNKIILRHDNICTIVISKKNCRIIDFICG